MQPAAVSFFESSLDVQLAFRLLIPNYILSLILLRVESLVNRICDWRTMVRTPGLLSLAGLRPVRWSRAVRIRWVLRPLQLLRVGRAENKPRTIIACTSQLCHHETVLFLFWTTVFEKDVGVCEWWMEESECFIAPSEQR